MFVRVDTLNFDFGSVWTLNWLLTGRWCEAVHNNDDIDDDDDDDDEADVISFNFVPKRYNLIENKIITDFDTSTTDRATDRQTVDDGIWTIAM